MQCSLENVACFLCLLIISKWTLDCFYDGSKHNKSKTICNSCNSLTLLERKISTPLFCTRNRNYIQSIESDCRNKGESLSFAHSYSNAWLDLSRKRTQFGILVWLKLKYICSILIYVEGFHMSWTLVLQQQQNLGRIFGTSKMHLRPQWLRLLFVLKWLFCCCWLFLFLLPLCESVIVLCFVVRYFMSIIVLQTSWWGRGSWLLCLVCLPGVPWWLCGSSSQCHGFVCCLWLWYFLIILTYYF